MRWVLITCVIMVVSVFMVNQAQGGTLDRGVHISSFFAGWANGDSTIAQLKYQMAIDSRIGITDRYVTVTYTYNYNYNSGVFNTFDVDVSNSGDSVANVTVNNSTYPE
jgi:hypothetical protein